MWKFVVPCLKNSKNILWNNYCDSCHTPLLHIMATIIPPHSVSAQTDLCHIDCSFFLHILPTILTFTLLSCACCVPSCPLCFSLALTGHLHTICTLLLCTLPTIISSEIISTYYLPSYFLHVSPWMHCLSSYSLQYLPAQPTSCHTLRLLHILNGVICFSLSCTCCVLKYPWMPLLCLLPTILSSVLISYTYYLPLYSSHSSPTHTACH